MKGWDIAMWSRVLALVGLELVFIALLVASLVRRRLGVWRPINIRVAVLLAGLIGYFGTALYTVIERGYTIATLGQQITAWLVLIVALDFVIAIIQDKPDRHVIVYQVDPREDTDEIMSDLFERVLEIKGISL